MNHKVFRVHYLLLIINDYPERLLLATPPVIPSKVSSQSHFYLEQGSSERREGDLHLEFGQVRQELLQFLDLHVWHYALNLIVVVVVNVSQFSLRSRESVGYLIRHVSIPWHFLISIG